MHVYIIVSNTYKNDKLKILVGIGLGIPSGFVLFDFVGIDDDTVESDDISMGKSIFNTGPYRSHVLNIVSIVVV